jgi:hypothetical protein
MPMDRALYIFFVEHVFLLFLCMEGTYGPPPPPRRSSSSSNRSRMPHTLAFWRMVEEGDLMLALYVAAAALRSLARPGRPAAHLARGLAARARRADAAAEAARGGNGPPARLPPRARHNWRHFSPRGHYSVRVRVPVPATGERAARRRAATRARGALTACIAPCAVWRPYRTIFRPRRAPASP